MEKLAKFFIFRCKTLYLFLLIKQDIIELVKLHVVVQKSHLGSVEQRRIKNCEIAYETVQILGITKLPKIVLTGLNLYELVHCNL